MQASASLQLPYRVVERLYSVVEFLRTLLTKHVNVQGHLCITSNACVQSQTKREILGSLFLEKRNKITQNFLTPKHDLRKVMLRDNITNRITGILILFPCVNLCHY
jgi:hypothetical protein